MGLVLLASLLIAYALSSRLHRLVSDPILHLARVARAVAQEKNYALRATKQSNDELGQLVDGFNEMLAQIQDRDAALQTARDSLERRVQERTAELATANQSLLGEIGERKRAEEALRASQQILEGILNAIPVRVFWKDKNLVYLGCNTIFAHDAGFADPKDIIGKDDFQLGWRDQAEKYRADDRQVIESGISKLLMEEPQTTPQGNTITLLSSKIPLRGSTGEISGILGTYLDITKRKRAEEALGRSREEFKDLFDNAPVGFHEVDAEGRLVRINNTELKMLGYSADELLGQFVWKISMEEETSRRAALAKLAGEVASAAGLCANVPPEGRLRLSGVDYRPDIETGRWRHYRHPRGGAGHHRAQTGRGGAGANQRAPGGAAPEHDRWHLLQGQGVPLCSIQPEVAGRFPFDQSQ